MILHDAHEDYEVLHGTPPEDPDFPGMDFPLPIQGNQSPNRLAVKMIAKITFFYGLYILLIRLIGLSFPDTALVLSHIFTAAFAIAFCIKCFIPERGMTEWPVWVGASAVLLFTAHRMFPQVLWFEAWPSENRSRIITSFLIPAAIVLLIIVHALSPSVKTLLTTKTKGPLALGGIGCFWGGEWAAVGYCPESDFSAWNYLAVSILFIVWPSLHVIADQFVRFEMATTPGSEQRPFPPFLKFLDPFPHHHSGLGYIAIPTSLWIGNMAFLATLNMGGANRVGLLAFLGSLLGFALIHGLFRKTPLTPNPVACAWDALTFWLTYNLQRNRNPNVFQCVLWQREPLVRYGIVGTAITALSLSLLHLSGIHAPPGRNKDAGDKALSILSSRALPQGHPNFVKECDLGKAPMAIYDRWSDILAKEGDAPIPPLNPVRTFGDLLWSAAVFFIGGPALFVFLLVTTQGTFIASRCSPSVRQET